MVSKKDNSFAMNDIASITVLNTGYNLETVSCADVSHVTPNTSKMSSSRKASSKQASSNN
jgi:hypothetical protein